MNPDEIAVGAGELVELRLLANPEDAQGHDTHQKNDQTRRKSGENVPQIALRVDAVVGGDAKIEHEQGHGEREDAFAESGQALDALAGNTVVEEVHPRRV